MLRHEIYDWYDYGYLYHDYHCFIVVVVVTGEHWQTAAILNA